jgi:hypothetical protein
MATKTSIANQMCVRIGEDLFTDVDADGTTTANEVNAIWDQVLEDTMTTGPEDGYKFSQWSTSDVDVDSTAITAFTDYSGTVAGTVLVTSTAHGLLTGDMTCITGTTSYDGDYSITKVSADTYYITATYVADDATGTSQWTSQTYAYRFPVPTSLKITKALDGGIQLTDWTRKRDWILTNLSSDDIEMEYILAISDFSVSDIPIHVIQVLWRKLAVHLLYSRAQNQSLQNRLTEEIETIYLPKAIGTDLREQYIQEENNSWTNAGHTTTNID